MLTSNDSFNHLGLAPKMLELLDRLEFTVPTPIQAKGIPIGLEGKDLFGVAQTGTGKTLAYGISIVQRLVAMETGQALVVVPTRELATQVQKALLTLLQEFALTSVVLIGGVPIHKQSKKLNKKPHVIIATPGRLIDHIQNNKLDLKGVEILVLDEADHMFDIGFKPQIEEIIKHLKKKRQTMLFSATMDDEIVKLATNHMKLPIRIEIAPPGTSHEQITQELFIVRDEKKRTLLKKILKEYRGSILIFVRTKVGAEKLRKEIQKDGYEVAEIHSDRRMQQRKRAIEGFKKGKYQILVATDIAARGIDVQNIEAVINFDLPDDVESFVHRIGRTGRAGEAGHAISFARPNQGHFVSRVEKMISKQLPITQDEDLSESGFSGSQEKRKRGRPSRKRTRSQGGRREGSSGRNRKDNKRSKSERPFSGKKRGDKRSKKEKPSKSKHAEKISTDERVSKKNKKRKKKAPDFLKTLKKKKLSSGPSDKGKKKKKRKS